MAKRALRVAMSLLFAWACRRSPPPPVRSGLDAGKTPVSSKERVTTDSSIALGNLTGEILSLEGSLARGELSAARQASLIELLLMRGQYLGRIADYERADLLADRLVERANDGTSYLTRAKTRSTFHRFADAEADLAEAQRREIGLDRIESARAPMWQAMGRYPEALTVRQRVANDRPDILSIGAVATILGELGATEAAEAAFLKAQNSYDDVSPFPMAWLYFQQGLMWMREGKWERARELLTAAHERLPQYASATGHLGEVEAALGHRSRAIALLRTAAQDSDDPDPWGQLARVLRLAGSDREADEWRDKAKRRFQELLERHPEAFADHGAEFFMAAGGDPRRALDLARRNLEVRRTPWAYELGARAAQAAGDLPFACSCLERAILLGHAVPSLLQISDQVSSRCGGNAPKPARLPGA